MEDPARSGWNWTLAPDIAPEEQEEERAEELDALKGVEGIEDIGVISFAQVRAAGERMTGVAMGAEQGAPSFTVVSGRMPSGPREIAVGPKTAEQLGLAIGDSVSLADPDLPDGGREAVVVGEVLMPTQDDNAFNEGVVLTPDALAAVAETDGFDQVVVAFADGIDEDEAAQRVRAVLPDAPVGVQLPLTAARRCQPRVGCSSCLESSGCSSASSPWRPWAMRSPPAFAAGVTTSGSSGRSGSSGGMSSVRSRPSRGRSLPSAWSLGIPLGIAAGRVAWQLVAEQIGVRASATTSPLELLIVALVAGLAGAALALPAGVVAARQRSVDALRAE